MRKVPTSLQVTQTECGLCSARSLLEFHGQELTISELRTVVEPGRDGLSLRQIGQVLGQRGMESRIYRVKNIAGLDVLEGPFIAHWKGYHFVVIESITAKHAVIMDPMVGRTKVSRQTVLENFSDFVLVAKPGKNFPHTKRPAFAAWRGKPIWPHSAGLTYLTLVLLSLLVFGFTLAIPLLTEHLVNRTADRDFQVRDALVAIVAVACGFVTMQILRTYVTTRLVQAVSWQLLNSAFAHLIRLPLRYFMSRPPGELMYRLNSLNHVRDLIASRIIQGMLDALTSVVMIGYVLWVSIPLGIAVLAISCSVIALLLVSQRLVKEAVDSEVHHTARSQSIQLDAVVSINNLRIGGYADTYLDDWRSAYRESLKSMIRRMRIQQGWIGSTITGVQAFAPLSIMIVSLSWARSGTVTLGQAVAVQGVAALIFGLSSSVFQSYTEGTVASRYLERVDDIYSYPPERSGGQLTHLRDNGITLSNVSFRYTEQSPDVIGSVSTVIQPGSMVALVGESGSGKTTLGKLLCSLYSPTNGSITYGGSPADDFDLHALRGYIGYIPQEGYLHNRTIAANLTLGTGVTEDEAIRFARTLPFMDFLDELPMGYLTVVSDMGSNFSGGQRQRIAIVKALIRKPQILVLDEATSALDNFNQRLVHDCLAELKCTQFVIAHRLSTVINADQILVLEDGCIQDFGTHDELARRDGAYARMFSDAEVRVNG